MSSLTASINALHCPMLSTSSQYLVRNVRKCTYVLLNITDIRLGYSHLLNVIAEEFVENAERVRMFFDVTITHPLSQVDTPERRWFILARPLMKHFAVAFRGDGT